MTNREQSISESEDVENGIRLLTDLYTFEDVAERFNIPESTLRHWAQARSLQHTRIGRHIRFSAEDLDAIIRSGRVEAQSPIRRAA
jgi:excisionase family DNA binding protein